MQMIKVIATDLDGTLFFPKRRFTLLTKKNTRFLKKHVENGNEVVLVTGRNSKLTKRIAKKIGTPLSYIACNGGFVFKDGELLMENCIEHEEAKKLYYSLKDDKRIKVWIMMTDHDGMYTQSKNCNLFEKIAYRIGLAFQGAYHEKYVFGEKAIVGMLDNPDIHIYKMMPIFGYTKKSKEVSRLASNELRERFGDTFEVAWSNEACELMKKGTSKADSLKQLIKSLEVSEDEVAVIGDSGNDISLFKAFHKNSFVMSHAHDVVKKEAKYIIDSVSDIEKYLEEGEK